MYDGYNTLQGRVSNLHDSFMSLSIGIFPYTGVLHVTPLDLSITI